ncbi:hypothetical protein N9A94_05840 [Akkermansiaceae bacterium]|nr:hypothetical protein [Akkermansiaceae bacterium]MDB4544456.1 hypothetical protein [Akkermansiaceae bacterium]
MKKLALLFTTLLLANCSSAPPSNINEEGAVESWWKKVYDRATPLENSDSLAGAKIPVLKSSLAASWGKPKIEVSPAGSYRLTYAHPSKPFTRLLVYGYVNPLPALATPPDASGEDMVNGELTAINVPQKWRNAAVKGKNVRWFQESLPSGADRAYFSTEGFTLTGPDGRKGHYRIATEGAEADFRDRLGTLGW